jgi:ribonuclease Y
MDATLISIIAAVVALLIGLIAGKSLFNKNTTKLIEEAESQAERIIKDAETQSETLKEKKMLEAKERFLQLKLDHEKEVASRNQKVIEAEKKILESETRIKLKEKDLVDKTQQAQKQVQEYDQKKVNLDRQLEVVAKKQEELGKQHEEHIKKLEKVANLKAEDAKKELIEAITNEAKTDAMAHVQEIMEEAKLRAGKEAKKIIIQTIQRTAAETAIENAITVFNLESDDIKGQIIGREGRNIRALEAATGVDLVVDDTPEAIILSSFDPLRREIARLSLQRLVQDGRMHPARIEEVVEKTKKQIEEQVMEIGERTVIELGVHGLHKELVRMVGRMRFRSSYGQNLLMHSRETANLCGIMAAELGLKS